MNILSAHEIHKSYGDRVVLGGVSLGIEDRDRIGLVGVNGSGKSTLLRILVGLEEPDTGTVARNRDLTVGFLPQEPVLPEGQTLWQVAAAGLAALDRARQEAQRVAARLGEGGELIERYENLQREVERLGGWDTDHLVREMLMHLGIDSLAGRPVEEVSGGQRKRAALARVLLAKPRLLVLDEPTNHLDADTVQWLEGVLQRWEGAVLLITHDRYFLDNVVDRMIELSQGGLTTYTGNYTRYLELKRERMAVEQRTSQRRLKLIEQELAWLGRSPSARRTKQKARAQRIEVLTQKGGVLRDESIPLSFQPQQKLEGDTILNAVGLSVGYGDNVLFEDFTLRMMHGDRIGILGPNGCGKSTLVKALLGLVELRRGYVELGRTTRLGYFDQERAGLDPAATLVEAVAPSGGDHVRLGTQRIHVRRYLDDFLFPVGEQRRLVASLSGGERNRILLAKLMAEGANLLVLDEPTNDLDLDTLQVLEDALVRYEGCLLVVTHDRYFLNRVVNGILSFEEQGELRHYPGDYDIYRRLRTEELAARGAERREESSRAKAAARPAPAPRAGLSWKEERELPALEAEIADLEARFTKVQALLADPSAIAGEPERLRRLAERHDELERLLVARMERWTELMEKQEA